MTVSIRALWKDPRMPAPTAPFAGSSKARQEIGLPGHCERCAAVGHVAAHPDLGCGDVGCTRAHGPEEEPPASPFPALSVELAAQIAGEYWTDLFGRSPELALACRDSDRLFDALAASLVRVINRAIEAVAG